MSYRAGKYVCRSVRASLSPDILQDVAVIGLKPQLRTTSLTLRVEEEVNWPFRSLAKGLLSQ